MVAERPCRRIRRRRRRAAYIEAVGSRWVLCAEGSGLDWLRGGGASGQREEPDVADGRWFVILIVGNWCGGLRFGGVDLRRTGP